MTAINVGNPDNVYAVGLRADFYRWRSKLSGLLVCFVAGILRHGRFQSVKLFGQAYANSKLTKQNCRRYEQDYKQAKIAR